MSAIAEEPKVINWVNVYKETFNGKQDYSHHIVFTIDSKEKMELFLTGRTLFITGYFGSAIFKFSEEVTVSFLKELSIDTFVRAAVAYDRKKYVFKSDTALKEIQDYFSSKLSKDEKHTNLYKQLSRIAKKNKESAEYSFDVLSLFQDLDSDVLTRDDAYQISGFGRTFSDEMVAYFTATQLITE